MKNIKFLDLDNQKKTIKTSLDSKINGVLSHSKYIMGPEVYELEKKLQEISNVKYAITCASGTDALTLSLMAMNLGKNDIVLCPSFTFPATAESIIITGATPVFIDVGMDSFNICYQSLTKAIEYHKENNHNVKAIMAVDLFGLPANYKRLNKIAKLYNLKIISDAAQSYGARYYEKRVGALADISCTSFFPAKPLGCFGDGGAVFTDDIYIKEKIESLRSHGKGKEKYEIIDVGLNSRLDTIQAAILLAKLDIFEWETNERNRIANIYNEQINDFYKKPKFYSNSQSAWAQYTLRTKDREKVLSFLKERGIPTMIYYPVPMHMQPAYKKYKTKNSCFNNCESLSSSVFSIPIHPYLSELQQEYIIENLNKLKSHL